MWAARDDDDEDEDEDEDERQGKDKGRGGENGLVDGRRASERRVGECRYFFCSRCAWPRKCSVALGRLGPDGEGRAGQARPKHVKKATP